MRLLSGIGFDGMNELFTWSTTTPLAPSQLRHCLPNTGPRSPFSSAHSSQMLYVIVFLNILCWYRPAKPQQFVNNTFKMCFCGYQWKAFTQIKPHLIAKNTAGAGAVRSLLSAPLSIICCKFRVLLHGCKVS